MKATVRGRRRRGINRPFWCSILFHAGGIMVPELWSLAGVATAIGCIHTLLGPDHYVPFVALSKAGRWTMRKTLTVTWLCGIAHVISSVALGFIGIALGLAVSRLEGVEELRGAIAAWMLVAFGAAYTTWGLLRAVRRQSHHHWHAHEHGMSSSQPHQGAAHRPSHEQRSDDRSHDRTPWVMFTIFLFGPCEPLIPLLMYPAATAKLWGLAVVTFVFLLATLTTMTAMVMLLVSGSTLLHFHAMERYGHALAGGLVLTCGAAMIFGL